MISLGHLAKRSFLCALALVLLGGSIAVIHAQTSWVASGTGDFLVSNNWDNGIPTSSTDVFITNGTLATPTVVDLAASASVASLELDAFNTLNVNGGGQFFINGALIKNGGAINLNSGGGHNSILSLNVSTTLSGGGTLTLNCGDNNGQVYIRQEAANLTLTNADNTIQGYGFIGDGGLTFINQATVNANSSGNTLTLNGTGGVTNTNAVLEATNGGTLVITTPVSDQNGKIISSGGTVNIIGGIAIQGGTLSGAGLETTSSAVLDGSTFGALTLSADAVWNSGHGTTTFVTGSIVNQGTINLAAGGGTNAILSLNGNTTLTGGGTITLNSGDNNGSVYIQQPAANLTLTNVDNLIQGYGIIGNGGLTFINQATVNANSSGNTLTLNGSGGVTNTSAVLEATNGGTLVITTPVSNQNGKIISSGGTVDIIAGIPIQGGTLSGAGLETTASAVLDGSIYGALTLAAGSVWTAVGGTDTYVNGSIVNQGAMNFFAGGGHNTVFGLNSDTALTGGGTINLYSGDNNGQVIIEQEAANLTLTNVDNLIQGHGAIGSGGLTFINQATVNANSSGNTLTLNGSGGVTNTDAILEATNGGTLLIDTAVKNQGGQVISGADSTVNISGNSPIHGGTLSGAGFETTTSAVLDGSVASGPLTLSSGSVWTAGHGTGTYVNGSIINQGAMNFFAGGGSNTYFGINDNTTLTGGGTVTLNSGDANGQAIIQQQSSSLTLTNVDNTIQGFGTIGAGGLTFINQATVNSNSNGNTLLLNAGGGITNTSALIEATNGGILLIATGINNQGGTIQSLQSTVNIIGGNSIQGGALDGPGFGTTNTATLDGSTRGALTLSPDFVWTAGGGTGTYVNGSIVNQGAMNFFAGGGRNTVFGLNDNTALTGGGTITLNSGDANGQAIIQPQAANLTLTNFDNTIQGFGTIGNGGLTFINQATVNSNSSGNTLTLNGGGGVTNNGALIEATNGGALLINTLINNQGGNITSDLGTVNIIGGNSIQGGTLSGPGFGTTNSAVLDGSTRGALTLSPDFVWTAGGGTGTYVNGSIVNQGAMNFFAGGGRNTVFVLNDNTTLTGGGTITLNSGDNNGQVYIQQQAANLTLTNAGNTIQGYGTIGNSGLTVVNGPAGALLANAPGQALIINGSGGLTNNGLMQVSGSSVMRIVGDFRNNGTVVLGASAAGAGLFSETGNYTQGSTGQLITMIDSGSYGTFTINGNVNLDGTLNIDLLNGFRPTTGQLFPLMDYTGTLNGTFAGIGGTDPNGWTLLNNPGQIDLEFTGGVLPIPEPGVWLDMTSMLPLILLGRKCRTRLVRRRRTGLSL
jgi:hypothetical protein